MAVFRRKYNTLLVAGTTAIRIPIVKRGVVDFAVSADWTPAAGDVKIAVDNTSPANVTNLPTATTSGNTAFWEFILTAAELSCKQAVITVSDSATKAVEDTEFIVETFGNASAMWQADISLPNLPANVTQLLGTAWLTPGTAGTPDVNVKLWNGLTTVALPLVPTTAGRTLDVSATGEAGIDWANIGSPTTTVALTNTTVGTTTTVTNQLTGSQIATAIWQDSTGSDFTTASSIGKALYTGNFVPGAAGGHFIAGTNAATTITGSLTTTFTGNLTGSIGSITNGAINSNTFATNAITNAVFNADCMLQAIRSGLTQSGSTSTTVKLDVSASGTTDFYKGAVIRVSGAVAGQTRLITAYDGTTKVATITPAWATTPSTSDDYVIMPYGPADIAAIKGTASAGAAGYMGIDWANIAAPTTSVNLSGTTIATVTNQLTAAQIATGVWTDSTGSDFTTASSIGKSLYTGNVAPGGSNGLMISGTNAGTTTLGALTITGATTHTGNVVFSDGITVSAPSTTNRAGISVTGNGTGEGIICTGGAAVTTTAGGHGISVVGGASSTGAGGTAGIGILVTGGAGSASTNGAAEGLKLTGGGTNTVASVASGLNILGTSTGHGIIATSGSGATGDGIRAFAASTAGNGLNCLGTTTGPGILSTGGSSGNGVTFIGGASGNGLVCTGVGTTKHGIVATGGSTTSHGISATGGGVGHGILATSGGGSTGDGIRLVAASTNGHGLNTAGVGTGSGVISTGGTTGHGFELIGGATSGNGMKVSGTAGNSIGLNILGQGSAAGLSSTGGATGTGVAFIGGGTSGNAITTSATSGTTYINSNLTHIGGTANPALAGYVGVDWGQLVNKTASNNLSSTTIATVTNQLTGAQIATAIWQDSTGSDFTTASSIGKALYTGNVVPGAAGGLFIAGTNAATTITTALTTTFTGNLTGSVGSVATGGITAASFAADAVSAAAVSAAAVAKIWAQAMTELSAVPGVTSDALSALSFIFETVRNKITQTATTQLVYKDDGTTVLATSTVSDDGTTFTRGEFS